MKNKQLTTVWVVTGWSGQYSDYSHWVETVVLSPEDGQAYLRSRYKDFASYALVIVGDVQTGVTQVDLGTRPGDYDPIYYAAEAFTICLDC